MNKNVKKQLTKKQAQSKYESGKGNLAAVVALTVINIISYFTNLNRIWLFSASIPFYTVVFCDALTEYSGNSSYLIGGLVIAAVFVGFYLACCLLCKKSIGWMIAALVVFSLDTLALLFFSILIQDGTGILDIAIHILVIVHLSSAIYYGVKMKKLPDDEPLYTDVNNMDGGLSELNAGSHPIRPADTAVKAKTLLEADVPGYHICYRRIKKTNELIINGYVYDEISLTIENSHELTAVINGTNIAAGFNGLKSQSYIKVNEEIVAKKLRLF